MRLTISRDLLARIWDEADRVHPAECCGILLGDRQAGTVEAIVPARNVARNPERHFEIDPTALFAAHREARNGGASLLGHYHSHPTGSAEPSETDARMAEGAGEIWVILGWGGQVAAWQALRANEAEAAFRSVELIVSE
ncbi:Mov34/MPN/PAD-1 family protein [Sphingobium sp. CR28]|uniref:Mov34/MPN/PAD-1 family protein n=1 Tax=Sphingobium sp. CR28 TaxID=3400272 RepID=UPI003FEDAF90